jgi:hypothetical protein
MRRGLGKQSGRSVRCVDLAANHSLLVVCPPPQSIASKRDVRAIEAMPADKRRGTTKKRTHNLGGCATCRRRHVKCDQSRPTCGTCRRAGHECSGYSSGIRWMSMSYGPSQSSRTSSKNKQSLQPFQGAIKVLFAIFPG